MADEIHGVPISDLPDLGSVPDDSLLVAEFLGKAYSVAGGVLRQLFEAICEAMGGSFDEVTEERLKAAIETVLADGKYNGVSPIVEIIDTEDGQAIMRVTDAFGSKDYPVEVQGATHAVKYIPQNLTDAQKEQARNNLGLVGIGKDGKDGYTPQKGIDYFDGKDGKDGYTPQKGVDYFDGTDGKDGERGPAGFNGVSPTAEIIPLEGGHRVEITDANGKKVFDVMNGKDAKPEDRIKSDHAENDPENPAHILNRTHWREVEDPVVLFDKENVGGFRTYEQPIGLSEGEEYMVTYGEIFTEAVGVAYSNAGVYGITLESLTTQRLEFTLVELSPELAAEKGYAVQVLTAGSLGHRMIITGPRITWHKLNRGYLPDDLGVVKRVNGQTPNEYGNVALEVGVLTVNGNAPDEYGNVEIEVGGEGGGTVQADLAENNPAASGYVKNRTHWHELELGDAIIDKTLTALVIQSQTTVTGSVADALVEGSTYLVTWNALTNAEYKCVCGMTAAGQPYIGNPALNDSTAETADYPFCIVGLGGTSYKVIRSTVSNKFAVKVQALIKEEWHKLDKRYLPDDIGGGVTDYNDLKNRPFGSNGVQTVELLPETTVEFDPEEGYGELVADMPMVEGATYTVRWNGVDYSCVSSSTVDGGTSFYVLGNFGALSGMGDTGEPFIIMYAPDYGMSMMLALDGSETATLSISSEIEDIDKMDGKFLPEGTPYTKPFDDVILEESAIGLNGSSGATVTFPVDVGDFIAGNVYNVVLDGVKYPVKAYSIVGGGILLGSGSVRGVSTDGVPYVNVPFQIQILPSYFAELHGGNVVIQLEKNFSAETIAIIGGKTVKSIDGNCLPYTCEPLILKLTKQSEGVYTSNFPASALRAAVYSQQPVWVYVYGDTNDQSWFPLCSSGSAIYQHMGNKCYVYVWQTDGTVKRTVQTFTTT